MKNILLIILVVFCTENFLAQPKWEKTTVKTEIKLALFHATQTASFPTTESLEKGNWMYEISHRFLPSLNEGLDALFGFDGPAKIKFALGYGITDDLMISFARSNLTDNYDLQLKQKLFQSDNKYLPGAISILVGSALNAEVPQTIERSKTHFNNFQFYAQLVYNTILFNKKLGVGIVPSYLYNSFIYAVDKQYTFTLGTYLHYYFNRMWSVWIEHNAIISGYQGKIRLDETGRSYNSVTFGIAIETGGHIFDIMATNNNRLNSSQYLVGANQSAKNGNWKLGFGIIRYF